MIRQTEQSKQTAKAAIVLDHVSSIAVENGRIVVSGGATTTPVAFIVDLPEPKREEELE